MTKDPTALRLLRRAMHFVGLGRGSLPASGASPIQTVQLIFVQTGEIPNLVPLMQHYGFASRPHAGCDYATIAIEGDAGKRVIVASNDQRYRLTLAEGEVGIHDDLEQKWHLTRTGIMGLDQYGNEFTTSATGIVMKDVSGSTITMANNTITAAPKNKVMNVTGQVSATGNSGTGGAVTGNWAVTGNISATGNITARGDIIAGSGTADQISLLGHTHTSEAAGSQTSAPTPGT